jgi:ABC-type antimicrobial peptide transport system permease subunit
MLAVSIASVVIASLILFICNYLHFMEIKKDIGLVRCLGVKEKESRKFVFMHSFIMTGISFILSSVELIVISIFLSKALSESLFIDSVFVFNPLSLVYMFGVAFLISIVSSLFISRKISKLDALECLQ